MAVVLDCKSPLLDFTLLGSAEGNEFRIDRGETRRGQVSGLPRIITSGRGEEGGQLPAIVFYTGSPLRSDKHAQITHRHTNCSQGLVLIGDLRLV